MSDLPPTTEELIAVYADDPAALTADERRDVEALIGGDAAAARMLAEARATVAALRGANVAAEPDWAALQHRIGAAVAAEPSPVRRSWRRAVIAGGVLAAAAIALLLLWPTARGPHLKRVGMAPDAAAPAPDPDDLTDEELAAELLVPDDLGGITVDDALIDEAAALADEPGDDPAVEPLLPDGTWIEAMSDDLSDEELDRVIALLEAG